MHSHLTFLVLDDDDDNRTLAAYALQKGFPDSAVVECATIGEALQTAQARPLDAIVTDHHLGEKEGTDFMQRLRALGVMCPVLMVTASVDPSVHARALAAGAAKIFAGANFRFVDYLQTRFPARNSPPPPLP